MTKSNETFKVLGKLLTETRIQTYKALDEKFEGILSEMAEKMYPVINESHYENKAQLLVEMKDALYEIELLMSLPQLANKSIIAISGDKREIPKLFEQLKMREIARKMRVNGNVPMLFYHAESPELSMQNELGNREVLAETDYQFANQHLYKQKIQVEQLVTGFFYGSPMPHEHIVFVYLPPYALSNHPMYRLLQRMTESVLLIEPPENRLVQWKLEQTNRDGSVLSKKMLSQLPEGFEQIEEIGSYFDDRNEPLQTIALTDTFKSAFQQYFKETLKETTELRQMVNGLSKDLVTVSDEKLENNIEKTRNQLRIKLKRMEESDRHVVKAYEGMVRRLRSLEQLFIEIVQENEVISSASKRVAFLSATIAITALETDQQNEYKAAHRKLVAWDSPYAKLLKAYNVNKFSKQLLNEIEHVQLDDVTARILVKYFATSSLQDEQSYKTLSAYYGRTNDVEVLVALGQLANHFDQPSAATYFRSAMMLGSKEAALHLMPYVNAKDMRTLESLANLLVPEANYIVGMEAIKGNRFARGMTAIKIAATFGYLPAIEELASHEFIQFIRVRKRYDKYDEEYAASFQNALQLNLYILDQKPSKEVKERVGKLYFWDYNYRRAEPLLREVDNADSNFMCGKMYQYGDVFSQDLSRAKQDFKRAMEQGHRFASIEYDKVTGWILSNQTKESYSSSHSYESTSSSTSSSSSSGWCFLTTATCVALGKEDNCEEIVSFQAFRDNHLRFDGDGRGLIVEYYRIAPILVTLIDQQKNSKEIYIDLYERYIKVGMAHLKNKDLKLAKRTYIQLVKELCETYHIEPFEDLGLNDETFIVMDYEVITNYEL